MSPPPAPRARLGAHRTTARRAFLLYTAVLLLATHWPRLHVPGAEAVNSDKVFHFGAFGLWTLLAFGAAYFGPALSRRNRLRVLALALGYAAVDETSQLVPAFERQFSVLDLVANLLGVIGAYALATMVARMVPDQTGPSR